MISPAGLFVSPTTNSQRLQTPINMQLHLCFPTHQDPCWSATKQTTQTTTPATIPHTLPIFPPSFIQDSKDITMADDNQNKILGFTKRGAEILIMSIQVIKPNQCTTNGCTVSSILWRHTLSSTAAIAGSVTLERIWSHHSQDLTGPACRPRPHRSLRRRRDGAGHVRCPEG